MLRLTISVAVALASAVPACGVSAQAGAPRADSHADSTLTTLATRDGAMRLALTSRSLRVGFTASGQRRIRRAADSAFAARDETSGHARPRRPAAAPALPNGPETDDVTVPDKSFPLRELQDVRASGDSLLVCFAAPPHAADPCGIRHRILITGVPPTDAQQFAAAVRRARAMRLGVQK